uniref:Uncharacterized protein n=1 Tax=Paramoeba aestuarina TaxID=180227 RepID=A0A7S4L9I1_9EUKA
MATDFIANPSASLATQIADACRVEKNRFRFINHETLVPTLITFLASQMEAKDNDGIVAALRGVGNLTYEIKKSREQCLENDAQGIKMVVQLLGSEHGPARRAAAGVTTNLISEEDAVQREVLMSGVSEKLIALLDDDDVVFMALRGLGNLCGLEGEKDMVMEKFIPKAVAFAREAEDNDDLLPEVFEILKVMVPTAHFWTKMKEEHVKNVALSVVMNTGLEKEGREKASDFLVTLSKSDDHRSEIMEFYDDAMAMNKTEDLICHATGIMLLAHMSLDDGEGGHKKLLKELDRVYFDLDSTDVRIQMGQAMLLGNLPHCHEDAIALAHHPDAFSLLVKYLKESEDERIHHLVAAGLRNLSIPKENKHLFKDKGVVETVMKLGKKSKNAPVKFECVRCVKGLLVDDSFEHEFYDNGGLEFLVEADESCSEEPAVRVAFEAGRIWVRLLENEERYASLIAASPLSEEAGQKKEGGAIESPLLKLLETKFDVLQAEGAKGCFLLFKGGYRPKDNMLCRRLSALLLDTDKVPVRSWCGRALNAFVGQKSEEKSGVEVLQEDEGVKVEDLLGALGTLVFDEESKEELSHLLKVLKGE